ncbi:ribosome maturation protein RimP [Novosphingobium aerophilum]|uniref:Ribosome maturation factor RimP n=1 Tax=Novosphingobium aerophilum TaxID=2839843 RepID=A0A7X1FB54_9SPHN|nr:ribosome maturation protein RimP [Novosphingobium aerophilum]MBC2653741.1 ribosome maturation protein RimP [Novosphingobium aerophilum]
MADIARLIEVIEPEVKALGFELVRVVLYKGGEIGSLSGDYDEPTLQIMAERPETGQLVLNDCAALSHRISDRIDALEEAGEVLIDDAYRLEVSSPGIDRPLTRLKDFVAWSGHEAKVNLTAPVEGNRKALQGNLAGVEGEVILLDDRKSGRVQFPFADVHSAKLVLTDRLIAATKPIDTTGADEEMIEAGAESLEEQED